jgi:hypothetical protein
MRPCWHLLLLCLAAGSVGTCAGDARAQGTTVPRVRDSNVGYIDPAIPGHVLRLRVDSANDNVAPTRADFFWSVGPPRGGGPRIPESNVDYQDIKLYSEVLITPVFSGFVELPVRFLDPEQNPNTAGLADLNLGVKRILIDRDDLVATFQFRTYAPTGDVDRGLGNNHVSLEPALLIYKPLSECWNLEAELRDWIPIDGTDFAGNIIRYGVGLSHRTLSGPCWELSPIGEFVGWTALDGLVSMRQPNGEAMVSSAAGDTIVNAKLGVRLKYAAGMDVYTGYGRALTGDTWYDDIYRLELRFLY